MKTLFLVRHAKSSSAEKNQEDFDRPLNARGEGDASIIGQVLKKRKVKPERVLCSTSKRTRETVALLKDFLSLNDEDIHFVDELYLTSPRHYIQQIRSMSNDVNQLMVIGHNPTVTELANDLTGAFIDKVPTTGVVTIKYKDDSWKAVGAVSGKLVQFDFPKKFKS